MKNQANTPKHSLAMRILLLVLVALMVLSLAFYTVWMIVDQIKAKQAENDAEEEKLEEEEHDHDHGEDPEIYY
jgi:flagellar basal body-associated protein FliL